MGVPCRRADAEPLRRIESIQLLRFAAASAVLVSHCASGHFFTGTAGVDLFFVISGFIISRVAAKRSTGRFIRDRLTRIYPLYWLMLMLAMAFDWDGDGWRLLSSLTLWPVFGTFRLPFLVVGWTLYFEMLFYAAAAAVTWRRASLWVLIALYLVAMLGGVCSGNAVLGFLGSPMLLEFGMGMVISNMRGTSRHAIGAAAILLGIAALFLFGRPEFDIIDNAFNFVAYSRPLLWGVPAAMIVWGSLQFERVVAKRLQPLSFAGDSSYSIYLSHPIAVRLFQLLEFRTVLKLALVPVLIGMGIAIHYGIERPLLTRVRDWRLLPVTLRPEQQATSDGA